MNIACLLAASIFLFCELQSRADENNELLQVIYAWSWPAVLHVTGSLSWAETEGAGLSVPPHTWNQSLVSSTCMISKLSNQKSGGGGGRLGVWGVKVSDSQAVNFSLSFFSRWGRARINAFLGCSPTAHCYPGHGGSHCCASSLSLTTSVNKALNNKQKACKSVCVTVSFSGLCFSPALATLMTLSKGACNGLLISFLWHQQMEV